MNVGAAPPNGRRSARKERALSLALILFGLGAGLGIAEIAVRMPVTRRADKYQPRIHAALFWDENGVRRFPPNASGYHKGYNREPVFVRINSHGFRGHELRDPPGKRIFFVGDSVVFDGGVELEDTFMARVERRLREQGVDVEIVNAGTSDIGLEQYERQIETGRFAGLHPDVIVIGLYLNDTRPSQGFASEKRDALLPFFDLPGIGNLALIRLLRQHYVAYRATHGELGERFAWVETFAANKWKDDPEGMRELVRQARFDWGAAWEPAFADTVGAAVVRIQHLCDRMGARLALALFPASPQVYASFSDAYVEEPQRRIVRFADEHHIPVIDLLPALRAHSDEELLADQCHLNARGNAVVADSLFSFVRALATAPAHPAAGGAPAAPGHPTTAPHSTSAGANHAG